MVTPSAVAPTASPASRPAAERDTAATSVRSPDAAIAGTRPRPTQPVAPARTTRIMGAFLPRARRCGRPKTRAEEPPILTRTRAEDSIMSAFVASILVAVTLLLAPRALAQSVPPREAADIAL